MYVPVILVIHLLRVIHEVAVWWYILAPFSIERRRNFSRQERNGNRFSSLLFSYLFLCQMGDLVFPIFEKNIVGLETFQASIETKSSVLNYFSPRTAVTSGMINYCWTFSGEGGRRTWKSNNPSIPPDINRFWFYRVLLKYFWVDVYNQKVFSSNN